jgi:hypothetical protein
MATSDNIGDSQEQAEETVVASLPMSESNFTDLLDEDSMENTASLSGKKLGAMYMIEVTPGVMEVVVAAGPLKDDSWTKLSGSGADTSLSATIASDISADITPTVDTELDTAAEILVQINLIEAAYNTQIDNIVTQLNILETLADITLSVASDISPDITPSVSGDLDSAAEILVQFNLIENAYNTQIDNIVTQVNLIETKINSIFVGPVITPV